MISFESYEDYKIHNYRFNLYFCTFSSILVSCIIGFILALVGFFDGDDISKTWIVIILLCFIPIIVFVAKSRDYNIQVAYYKRWFDSIHGILDRKKILKQFAQVYGISSWRKKIKKIEADGRWHFHANTNYIKTLATERDAIIGEIEKNYINEKANVDRQINDVTSNLEKIQIEFDSKFSDESETMRRLNTAKSSDEIYVQRRNAEEKKQKRVEAQQGVSELKHEIETLKIRKSELGDICENNIRQINLIYDERYRRYAEYAVKRINEVNGLKYDLEPMEK